MGYGMEIQKASAAIHISHNLSLLQLQIWNILLCNAYSSMGTRKEFDIVISEILSHLDSNTNNVAHIKKALVGLCSRVEFNLLDKDRYKRWGFFHLLESVVIKNGICTYQYHPRLQTYLQNPQMFAKINLLTQKKFQSKYSLFLYELAFDYRGVQQTPWIKIETFKTYMGLKKNSYPTFTLVNKHIIKKAVAEVNQVSDISVETQFKKENKKVVAVKFIISEKVKNPDLREKLTKHGIEKNLANRIVDSTPREDIEYTLKLAQYKIKKIKNLPAWLVAAFAGGWRDESFDKEIEQVKKRKLAQEKQIEFEKKKKQTNLRVAESFLKKGLLIRDTYEKLPDTERRRVDAKFEAWVRQINDKLPGVALSLAKCKIAFLAKEFAGTNENPKFNEGETDEKKSLQKKD